MESCSKRRRVETFVAAISVVSCGGSSQPAVSSESGAPTATNITADDEGRSPPKDKARFSWPVSRAIPVMHKTANDASSTQARYLVQVCPGRNGRLRIEIVDVHLVAIDGLSSTDPRVAARADSIAADLTAIPALTVEATGVAVGAEGFDELFVRLAAKFPASEVERLRPHFETEKGRELLWQTANARWRSWIETWLIYDPALGSHIEVTGNVSGRPERHKLSFDGWKGSHAKLSFELELSKEGAKSFLGWVFEANRAQEPNRKTFETAEVIHHGQIETDWPDIRPHWVFLERTVRVTVAGEPRERTHSHEYGFDWANSKEASCQR